MDLITVQAIASILSASILLLKPVRRKIKICWIKVFGVSTKTLLLDHVEKEEVQLNRIEAELHPNGGSSMRDVIERIGTRQRDFEAFQLASLNIQDVAVFRTDIDGKIIFTNRAHQRLTGFSQEEAEGDGWINYVDPSERSRLKKIWEEVVDEKRELAEDILFIYPETYKTYMVRAHVYKETDGRGAIRGYLGIIQPLEHSRDHHKLLEDLLLQNKNIENKLAYLDAAEGQ